MTPYEVLSNNTSAERQYLLSAPIHGAVLKGQISLEGYRVFLTNAFHHVRFTVPLIMAAASRIDPNNKIVCDALQEYIREEYGHEQWILDDLNASHGDAASTRSSTPGFEVELMVAYVRDYIEHTDPIGFLGMVFVLEGTSVAMAYATADLIQQALKLPDTAFSYLRSHGSLDIEHLSFFEELTNTLSESQLNHVIHVARRVFHLYGNVLRSVPSLESDYAAA
ncbi:MAG: hypothetical protein ACI9ON_003767 [Limisphaerales bacterium]|jgi:hypothetical protein